MNGNELLKRRVSAKLKQEFGFDEVSWQGSVWENKQGEEELTSYFDAYDSEGKLELKVTHVDNHTFNVTSKHPDSRDYDNHHQVVRIEH